MSNDVSLWALARDPMLSAGIADDLDKLFHQVIAYGTKAGEESLEIREHPELGKIVTSLLQTLKRARKRSDTTSYAMRVLQSGLACLNLPGQKFSAEFSPVRKYPRLRLGPSSVAGVLDYIWRLPKSFAVLSATISLPRVAALTTSDDYVRGMLAMPSTTRSLRLDPPEWLTAPMTAYMATREDLCPPSSAEPHATHHWVKSLAQWLHLHVLDSAAGGTLILCTSYDTAEALGRELSELVDPQRLVIARQTTPLLKQRRQYEALWPTHKPIWVATGAAWTGLDLVAKAVPPENDDLVTDLVIPRLPFRIDRSMTHASRVNVLGFFAELSSMLLLLKQGIGRAIRREGLKHNRRLWILDGRLNRPTSSYQQPVAMLLSAYRQGTSR